MSSQTHTTSRGECPDSGPGCQDFCNSIQICVELEKGECDGLLDLANNTYHRYLYNYRIKINNCGQEAVNIDSATLDFEQRIIYVNSLNIESFVPGGAVITNNDPIPTQAFPPTYRTLVLNSGCGSANLTVPNNILVDYEGGLGTSSDALLRGNNTVIPPGDCCISLVFSIDVQNDSDGVPLHKIYVQPAPLCIQGHQTSGDLCCEFSRSLLVPGDCVLQSVRGTLFP